MLMLMTKTIFWQCTLDASSIVQEIKNWTKGSNKTEKRSAKKIHHIHTLTLHAIFSRFVKTTQLRKSTNVNFTDNTKKTDINNIFLKIKWFWELKACSEYPFFQKGPACQKIKAVHSNKNHPSKKPATTKARVNVYPNRGMSDRCWLLQKGIWVVEKRNAWNVFQLGKNCSKGAFTLK